MRTRVLNQIAGAAAACFLVCPPLPASEYLDLAPFATPCCVEERTSRQTWFEYGLPRGLGRDAKGRWVYGLQWAEDRDIREVAVRSSVPDKVRQASLEYWARTWPPEPPSMPNTEDPADDPWQGGWIRADSAVTCEAGACRFTFRPLSAAENPRAMRLPGVTYRRALKIRLVFPEDSRPRVSAVQTFSDSTLETVRLRLRFSPQKREEPVFVAYNGAIRETREEGGAWLCAVDVARPKLPGSNDTTVVQVRRGVDVFSFAPGDAEKGPMFLPGFHALITLADTAVPDPNALVKPGARIRERLAREPEQSYERASREIPPLDPVNRQYGGRLYVPLAADASWQKFAFHWGGHVMIDRRSLRVKDPEARLLTWPKDRIEWRLGTGETPDFREPAKASTLSMLEDHLPVATARWSEGGLEFEEEAFATLLDGPLAPDDPARDERTPAVLMIELRMKNPNADPRSADLWLGMRPAEALALRAGFLTGAADQSTRARVRLPDRATAQIEECADGEDRIRALHVRAPLAAQAGASLRIAIPFQPGLSDAQRVRLSALDFASERARVLAYWRGVIGQGIPFEVPERRFDTFARGLVARIGITAVKDANSGLVMVPAASYDYGVYADESVFQIRTLDLLGYHARAARYLETFVKLQGSKPFAGSYRGDQKAVYHGVKVDASHDYTTSDYNRDHGLVMLALANHYWLTRDRQWLLGALPGLKRAADWIVEQRQFTKTMLDGEPCPEYGLLPGGHLSDNDDWGHWFTVNAHASAGLSEVARILAETGDAGAADYRDEAAAYREDLRAAALRAARAAPVVRLRDNTYVPYVPTRPHVRIRAWGPRLVGYYSRYTREGLPTFRLAADREVLNGPLLLLENGIFAPDEPIARWMLDDWEDNATMSEPLGINPHGWVDEQYWFSRGGMVFQANLYNPSPTYLRRREIPAAIRSLYNSFVACYYPAVNIFTEEFRQWQAPSGPFYKTPDEAQFVERLRDFLVVESDRELQLAAGAPRRWLEPGQTISVTRAPTRFGVVSYQLTAEEERIRGTVVLPESMEMSRARISVRVPENHRIGVVTIDGKPWSRFDKASGTIELPKTAGTMQLSVSLSPARTR